MSKAYRFQKRGIQMLNRTGGRAILADEMGLGKTFQALGYGVKYVKRRPFVVVCPASIKWKWKHEAVTHYGLDAVVLDGLTAHDHKIPLKCDVIILNYRIVEAWTKTLRNYKPELIILDECHYIKNRQAKRTKWTRLLCNGVKHVVALSGTPITNKPEDIWATLNILRPDLFPHFFPFGLRYCAGTRGFYGWDFSGASNLDELQRTLRKTVLIRRTKSQVFKDMPPKTRIVLPIEIEKRSQYRQAWRESLTLFDRDRDDETTKAAQLTSLGNLIRLTANLKLQNCIDWISDFLESGESLIVFGIHKKILNALAKKFKPVMVKVDGSVTGHKRRLAIRKFQRRRAQLFIGQMYAVGVGWDGQIASNVAFVELPWNPAVVTQAEDRAHRIGTKKPVSCYYLIARDTIETKLCEAIQRKQTIVKQAIDGTEGDDLDVFEMLKAEMQHYSKKEIK